MPDVFLSYKREDWKFAARLIQRLRAAGLDVWWDHDIAAGAPWEATIERALTGAKAVVVCWSKAAVASENVRSEARWAREQGRLIQIFVEPCAPPLFFGERQGVDLSAWNGDADAPPFRQLVSALFDRLGQAEAAPPPPKSGSGHAGAKRSSMGGKPPWLIAAAVVALMLAGVATWLARDALPWGGPPAARIAVAPIDSAGGSAWLNDFAGRVSDQILGNLSARQLPTLSGADAAALRGADSGAQARRLGARLLIDGTARADGDSAVVSLHFVDPRSHATVWSVSFQGEQAKADDLRGQIAAKVAAMLDCGARALRPVGGLKDPDALSSYLKACDLFQTAGNQFLADPLFQLFAALRRVIAISPGFAAAHSDLAKYEAYFAHYGVFPAEQAPPLREEARAEAGHALALDAKNADAYVALMFLVPRPGWAERERLLRKALAADPDWPHANGFLGMLLNEVGRVQEAAVYIQRAAAANPANPDLGWNGQSARALSNAGRDDLADGIVAQLSRLWPGDQDVWNAHLTVDMNAGRWADALQWLKAPGRPANLRPADVETYAALFEAAGSRSPAQLAKARGMLLDSARTRSPVRVLQGLAILGDLDDAFAMASSPAIMATPDGPYATLFAPPTRSMRQDPRFMALAARLGLVAYWRSSGRWPDFCAEPGLPYDCKAAAAKLAR